MLRASAFAFPLLLEVKAETTFYFYQKRTKYNILFLPEKNKM